MCKVNLLVSFVVFVALVANASAQTRNNWTDGDPDDHLWSSPDNWSLNAAPAPGHIPWFDIANTETTATLVEEGTDSSFHGYVLGDTKECHLVMTGGSLTTAGDSSFGRSAGGHGVLHLSGGTIYNGMYLKCGWGGLATAYMTGGKWSCAKTWYLPLGTQPANIYLYGGVMNPMDNLAMKEQGHIDIQGEGRIEWNGTRVTELENYVRNGWITAYNCIDGELGARVMVEYDSENNMTVAYAIPPDYGKAWNPDPESAETIETLTPTLTWKPGLYVADADGHDVYFGTDFDDVNDADRSDLTGIYKGCQDSNMYDPGALALGQTYYWRIDEVNEPNIWRGDVWSFTTIGYLVVDDMESYGNVEAPGPPPPPGSRIWYTWKDGEGWTRPWVVQGNGSGSVVDPNGGIVHGGVQSLKFIYDNDGTNVIGNPKEYYSEIRADTADVDIGHDWTIAGVKALSLYFYGDVNNDANATEQMYLALEDEDGHIGIVLYDGDMDDIRSPSWHEWLIDLGEFGDANVDLSNVRRVYIGFGDRDNHPNPGGSGKVYFDDIRLYPARCLLGRPESDLNGDCVVNFEDFAVIVAEWLNSGMWPGW